MKKPPSDDSDLLQEVMAQVEVALDALDLGEPSTRESLLEGLRDALRDPDPQTGTDSSFFVMQSEPPEEGPDLRVVDTEEAERITQAQTHSDVRVRVVRPKASTSQPRGPSDEGRIHVRDGAWQTVYRGDAARPYRLSADTLLEVALDGVSAEQLKPSQTMDVEARLVRVRPIDQTTTATGWYRRL